MNIRASSEIARHVRDKVAALGYKTTDDRSSPDQLHTLKDRLRNGPGDIQILAKNRFEIALSVTQFNQTVRREFFDGIVRVKGLEKSVQTLSEGKAAAAWLLTTCYYTSFFAAIEILRCSGLFVSYFHEKAVKQIKQRSPTTTGHEIESGTYVGSAVSYATTDEVKITFVKKHYRHHEATWDQLREIVTETRKKMTGIDAVHQEQLEKFIGNDGSPFWPSPSDTRNLWNYEDASLFGKNGEVRSGEFRKLTANKQGSLKWGGQKRTVVTDESRASSMAFIMNALLCTTEELSAALLPESLSKLLPRA